MTDQTTPSTRHTRPDRPTPPTIEVLVTDRHAVVVGGGASAIGPVTRLLRAGARVTVVAPHVETALEDLIDRGLVTWHERDYEPDDLLDADLAAAATGSADLDARVHADCARQGGLAMAVPEAAAPRRSGDAGSVVLVGGGPGAPGLITVAGREAVLSADVVVVDRLAPLAILDDLGPEVEIVDVSKIPRGRSTSQERINQVLIERARAGKRVARLKGGDPFVFGRGMEEQIACADAGIAVEVIPGVTSAVSAPALAGIPVTHRGVVQGFAVVSGHAAPDDPRSTVDWAALGASGLTVVVLMGVETLPRIARTLLESGRPGDTPVASVMDAAMPSQRVVSASLADLADGSTAGITAPAVTVIGDVARFVEVDRFGVDPRRLEA